jgi:hypothetical protein
MVAAKSTSQHPRPANHSPRRGMEAPPTINGTIKAIGKKQYGFHHY